MHCNDDGSATDLIVHEDAGVQIFTVIVGAIVPPWAKDATGQSLPTHYEIEGQTLTQIVDDSTAIEYPVVADAWLGIQLFTNLTRGVGRGRYTHDRTATPAGAVGSFGGVGGAVAYAHRTAVLRGRGWGEWKSRWPDGAMTNKATGHHDQTRNE